MSSLQWFRLYHRIVDDEKIRLIAFEDRWHFIAVCCLKSDGLLDEPDSDLKWRKVAVKLGVQVRELDEIKRRLFEVGLIDADMQPTAWDELQYRSDSSTERVKKYREKSKANRVETERNVSVTPQDTDTDTDTDTDQKVEPVGSTKRRAAGLLETAVERDFQESLWVDFPRHQNSRRLPALKAFCKLSPQDRTACIRGAVAYSLRFESDATDKRPLEERLRYVPHLVTWINQRGWETELEAAR